ncbi:glutathione S-transferase family protein [Aliirhizobium smilacinae]|uniref:Glutathione S-transferase family protein n=1 Tax=Aliirhizobium smilacinae TaxID=1395944 RepID=A0A5C4XCA9_9HYPH|nr:glutathione S-transferase family protein [Rhizobium smilacinae]TNM60929.1 glutathione S-transferase family protein [Rhizobium smilacinae]
MDELTLYIGNKNYSSWSFRPWIALTAAGVPFREVLIPFDDAGGNPEFRTISPTGRVPVLHHGEFRVWESLAIIEYVAELFPEKAIWPKATADRAVARSISMEMLSGFRGIRNACPMNIRRPKRSLDLPQDVQAGVDADVARISAIWTELTARSGGPYLFGEFSAADAMFAPVVNRFEAYELSSDKAVLAYIAAMKAHSAWKAWETAALAETWIVPADEA